MGCFACRYLAGAKILFVCYFVSVEQLVALFSVLGYLCVNIVHHNSAVCGLRNSQILNLSAIFDMIQTEKIVFVVTLI